MCLRLAATPTKTMRRFLFSVFILLGLSAIVVHTQNLGGANASGVLDFVVGKLTIGGVQPVTASSPGAGLAHFAGSTNVATSSAVNLASGDVTGILPIANGGTSSSGAAITFQVTNNSTTGVGGIITQNHIFLSSFFLPYPVTFSNMVWAVNGTDNSANSYDIGLYGPGCLGGAAGIPLAAHTGTAAGSVLFPTSAYHNHSVSGAPLTLQPGYYALAYTTSAASPTASLKGDGGSNYWLPFALSVTTTGGGAALPSTVTCPATSFAAQNMPNLTLY